MGVFSGITKKDIVIQMKRGRGKGKGTERMRGGKRTERRRGGEKGRDRENEGRGEHIVYLVLHSHQGPYHLHHPSSLEHLPTSQLL